jgi:hypothetical protein
MNWIDDRVVELHPRPCQEIGRHEDIDGLLDSCRISRGFSNQHDGAFGSRLWCSAFLESQHSPPLAHQDAYGDRIVCSHMKLLGRPTKKRAVQNASASD